MKAKYILALLATATLCACEDYTEKNFGSLDELWQPTEINNFTFTLTPADYQKVTQMASNIALAEENGASEELARVGKEGAFNANIAPADYLPAIFDKLVGSKFYAATAGSTITIVYNMDVPVPTEIPEAYTQVTSTNLSNGTYLLVPHGTNQVLTSSHENEGYGYLNAVEASRINANTLSTEGINSDCNFSIYNTGEDSYYISNSLDNYLYLKDTYTSFNFIEDLGDLDDAEEAEWSIVKNEDDSYSITNTFYTKSIFWSISHTNAGAYDTQTADYLPVDIYRYAKNVNVSVSEIEQQEIVFTLDEDGVWYTKQSYIDMPLTGGEASSDVDRIFELCGWSIEYDGGIGDLTYVWRLDSSYGLRASAYKNPTYYPTDAWAISPRMNMKKAVEPIMTFEQAQKYAGTPVTDYLRVYISTDYNERGDRATAHWDDVTDALIGTWPDGSNWDYSPMTLDMSKYTGQPNVHIAFRYISTDTAAATWEVKNVRCVEKSDL